MLTRSAAGGYQLHHLEPRTLDLGTNAAVEARVKLPADELDQALARMRR